MPLPGDEEDRRLARCRERLPRLAVGIPPVAVVDKVLAD